MTDILWIIGIFVALNLGLILLTSIEQLKGLKTKLTSLAVAAVGAVQSTGIGFIKDETQFGVAMIGLGVTMAVLRVLTKQTPN